MNNDPYGRGGDELARLAREGEARLRAAQQGQHASAGEAAERNLRTALGPVRGAPVRRALLAALGVCLAAIVVGVALAVTGGEREVFGVAIPIFANVSAFACFGLFSAYMFVPPMASRAGVEAERAWAASLPFPMDWYFELLASEPRALSRIRVELWWAGQGVDPQTLQGLIALFDTAARVERSDHAHAAFTTGPISGMTGIRVNRVPVYRNHRLGAAVHRLVDVVLLPLHRNAPLARVKLSRA